MDWTKVTVLTTTEGADIVSEQLIEAGANGTMIEDRNDIQANQRPEGQWDIIDESIAQRMGEDVRVSGYYAADNRLSDVINDIRARVARLEALRGTVEIGKLEILTDSIDDEDWAEYWKKQYVPMRLGRHTVVKPSWTDYELQPGDRLIELDPGMAFGTGSHETTGLCTALVEEIVKPGDRVLDVGTGTGILAIAAALAGAKEILAVDIDPVAVRVARENVARNHLSEKIAVRQGDLLKDVSAVADVLIANIIADVIVWMCAGARERIAAGGAFICSGIAREKQDEVIAALKEAGYRDLDVREKGEWCAIACKK